MRSATPSHAARTGATLAAGWAAVLLGGYLLGRLISDARPGWDQSAVTSLRGSDHATMTDVIRAIAMLGSPLVLDIVFVLACVALLAIRHWRSLLFLVLASPGSVVLIQALKQAVDRARPAGPHLARFDGPSWPSADAGDSLALYTAVLLIALSLGFPRGRRARRLAIGVASAIVGLIGFARVYLAVHYPTDVLGAWLLIAAWLTIVVRASPARVPWRRTRRSVACR